MTKRLHGEKAIRQVELHGGQLYIYGEHQPGAFVCLEDQVVEIENREEDFARLRQLAAEKPHLIYVDIEEIDEIEEDVADAGTP